MKTYKHLWEKFVSLDNLELAIANAAKGHSRWKSVKAMLEDVEGAAKTLQNKLLSGNFDFGKPFPKIIKERGKERAIVCPRFKWDHVIHHAIVQALGDVFMSGMHPDSCGSIPGRGTSHAKKIVEKTMGRHKPKYYLQMDVRHFFASIDPEVLIEALRKKIKDRKMLSFLEKLIKSTKGLPLGYYTSQWFANFLLTDLDNLISGSEGVKRHVRYMDDVVVFGKNKRALKKVKDLTKKWLENHELELKPNWKINLFCREKGMPLDFLGFKFGPDKTVLRKSLFLRLRRKFFRVKNKLSKSPISSEEAAAAISYYGWLKSADCFGYRSEGKVDKLVSVLKNVVSKGA